MHGETVKKNTVSSLNYTDWLIDWLICDLVRDRNVPILIGLNWRALCVPYKFMGALLLYKSSRGPLRIIPLMFYGSKKKEPKYACLIKPKFHTRKACGQSFHPLLHTYNKIECLTAPFGEDVSSGYYIQWEGQ
jgi:hypothetical protein